MTRFEFMYRLEQELQDISFEEREEALKYYEEYIADAGTLSDDQLVKEFGTPEKVAAMIKADLSSGKEKEAFGFHEESKIYTERGFEDTEYADLKFEVVGDKTKSENTDESKNGKADENEQNFGSDFGQKQYEQAGSYYNYDRQAEQKDEKGRTDHLGTRNKKLLWILFLIFFVPIVVPIIFGLFSGVFGVASAIFCTLISVLLISVCCSGAFLLSGLIITIIGIIRIVTFSPMEGIFILGMGILLFGIGMFLVPLTAWIFRDALPAFFRIIRNLFNKIFKNRRGAL